MADPVNPPAPIVPMFDSTGTLRDVPYDKVHEAVSNGMKPGVRVKFPNDNDQVRYVPPDKYLEATHEHGATVLPIEDQSTDHPGFWAQVGSVVHGMLSNVESDPAKALRDQVKAAKDEGTYYTGPHLPTDEENAARKAKGLGPTYRALVPAAEAVGMNVKATEKAADEGDVSGVEAQAAIPAALALAHPAGKLAGAAADAIGVTPRGVAGAVISHIPGGKTFQAFRTVAKAIQQAAEEHRAANAPGVAPIYRDATLHDVNIPEYAGEDYGPNVPQGLSQIPPDFQPQRKLFGGRTVPPLPPEELARMDQARAAGRARQAAATPPEEVKSQPAESAPGATAATEEPPASAAEAPKTVEKPALPKLVRDPKTGRMMRADVDLLNKASALRQPVHDIVDTVTDPGTAQNLQTKSEIEFYLKKGDVVKAQAALDAVKPQERGYNADGSIPGVGPDGKPLNAPFITPEEVMQDKGELTGVSTKGLTIEGKAKLAEEPTPYPSAEPIKAPQEKGLARDPATGRVMNADKSQKFRTLQDKLEDKGIVQDLDQGLTKEGKQAYRQFIKDNSPPTKGELTGTTPDMPGWGRENAIPKPKKAQVKPIDDLTDILNKSLKQAQLMKEAGASKGAIQEMQAKKLPVGGGSPDADSEALRAEGEKQFQIQKDLKEKPNVEPFFSKAKWVTDEKIPNVTSGESALATLRNAGVKEGEIKWMGLDDYLKGKTKVSRADIQGYIKEHEIKLGEVDKSAGKEGPPESIDLLSQEYHQWTADNNLPNDSADDLLHERLDTLTPAQTRYLEEFQDRWDNAQGNYEHKTEGTRPKYEQYTLPGEKSNYSEKLLTLPNQGKIKSSLTGQEMTNTSKQFQSGHFDEPNVLAHVRYDDRVDAAGKKTLFLEEVQSDWHQKGKKEGYQGDLKPGSKLTVMRHGSPVDVTVGDRGPNSPAQNAGNIWVQNADGHGWFISKTDLKGVPDAPFKSDWHELVMKRMLREAAEKGYDKLAWTTGAQQAERYDLSKQADSIHYFPDTGHLDAVKGDEVVLEKQNITPEKLADYIGKDAAKKLLESPLQESKEFETPHHKIEGDQLKVGGKWAERLYDQAIPNFLNKYAKKWGAKVGTAELPGVSEKATMTPEQVLEKIPDEEYTDETHDPIMQLHFIADYFDDGMKTEGMEELRRVSDQGKIPLNDLINAVEHFTKVKIPLPSSKTVHSIDITPEMKRDVLKKGQPIAAKEEPKELVNA